MLRIVLSFHCENSCSKLKINLSHFYELRYSLQNFLNYLINFYVLNIDFFFS